MNALSLLSALSRPRLLHFLLGSTKLFLSPRELPARALGLHAVFSVLFDGGAQPIPVLRSLLFEVPDSVLELVAVLLPGLQPVAILRLVGLLSGQGECCCEDEQDYPPRRYLVCS